MKCNVFSFDLKRLGMAWSTGVSAICLSISLGIYLLFSFMEA